MASIALFFSPLLVFMGRLDLNVYDSKSLLLSSQHLLGRFERGSILLRGLLLERQDDLVVRRNWLKFNLGFFPLSQARWRGSCVINTA